MLESCPPQRRDTSSLEAHHEILSGISSSSDRESARILSREDKDWRGDMDKEWHDLQVCMSELTKLGDEIPEKYQKVVNIQQKAAYRIGVSPMKVKRGCGHCYPDALDKAKALGGMWRDKFKLEYGRMKEMMRSFVRQGWEVVRLARLLAKARLDAAATKGGAGAANAQPSVVLVTSVYPSTVSAMQPSKTVSSGQASTPMPTAPAPASNLTAHGKV